MVSLVEILPPPIGKCGLAHHGTRGQTIAAYGKVHSKIKQIRKQVNSIFSPGKPPAGIGEAGEEKIGERGSEQPKAIPRQVGIYFPKIIILLPAQHEGQTIQAKNQEKGGQPEVGVLLFALCPSYEQRTRHHCLQDAEKRKNGMKT